jgi:hypothetical protein
MEGKAHFSPGMKIAAKVPAGLPTRSTFMNCFLYRALASYRVAGDCEFWIGQITPLGVSLCLGVFVAKLLLCFQWAYRRVCQSTKVKMEIEKYFHG